MPQFVFGTSNCSKIKQIPTFVFHDIEPWHFAGQLDFLKTNGYQTITADQLEERYLHQSTGEKQIALTFDDATWTFWAYAFPLLKRYGYKAILFVIPGLVASDDTTTYPNIDDVLEGNCTLDYLNDRRHNQPLCTWTELEVMHQSGLVDIQSHSLAHSLIPINYKVADFHHPNFDTHFYGNVHIPLSALDDDYASPRELRLGAPIFKSASRFKGLPRFIESTEMLNHMISYVQSRGGVNYFDRPNWRAELLKVFNSWPSDKRGRFESHEEMKHSIYEEMVGSKKILESKLQGKKIAHFCYPWFQGSQIADNLAHKAGYRTAHYGIEKIDAVYNGDGGPVKIGRISEEYLYRLPGKGRRSFFSVWKQRIQPFLKGQRNI